MAGLPTDAQGHAILCGPWALRGWSNVERALVNLATTQVYPIDEGQFFVLGACDGSVDFRSAAYLGDHMRYLRSLCAAGIVRRCEPREIFGE